MEKTHLTDRASVEAHIEATELGESPAEMRAGFERLAGPQPPSRTETRGGHEVLSPVVAEGVAGPPLIFFHGGGYVFGSPESHMTLAARLARSGVDIRLPRYPLAPEAPWPAQLDAALAVVDAISGPVALGGISAGGHLALNAALARPGSVSALLLISPNTDRSGASRTRRALEHLDLMNDDATDARLARMAMGNADPRDPQVSPRLADLSRLPPTRILVGAREILLDDALLLARAAALHGRPVSLDLASGLFHMAQLWPEAIPQAGGMLDQAADWLSAERSSAG